MSLLSPTSEDLADQRAIPNNLESERSVLSSILQDPHDRLAEAQALGLQSADFYLPSHALLYTVFSDWVSRDQPINLVTLHENLTAKELDSIGGPSGLVEVSNAASSAAHFDYYIGKIKESSLLRRVIEFANFTIEEAYNKPPDVPAFLDQFEASVLSLNDTDLTGAGEESFKELLDQNLNELTDLLEGKKDIIGHTTGFWLLDRMIDGLKAPDLNVIAARPAMGKTSFMMNIVEHNTLDRKRRTAVFSCEMSRKQILSRLLYSRSRIDYTSLKNGAKLTKEDIKSLTASQADILAAEDTLLIDDTAAISIGQLRAVARRWHRQQPLQLLAVDYLQLMTSPTQQANGSREREIAQISAGLKSLAKELQIPVIALAQINREAEKRTGNTPRMADLRESGAIEQDADSVTLLHRPGYYAEQSGQQLTDEEQLAAQAILAKNRHGPTGVIPLIFKKETMRFESTSLN